jgi:hypothetical protein
MQPFGLLDNRYSSDDPRFALNYAGGGVSGETPTNADALGRLAYGLTNVGGVQDAAGLLGSPSLRENVSGGNYLDALLQGVGVIPGVGLLAKAGAGAKMAMAIPAAAKAGKAAKAAETIAEAAPEGIIAYHGSPHSFDRFDISKIGTGEGAQAYGHGLYFADNENVAKEYRDALAPGVTLAADGRRLVDMPDHERQVYNYLYRTGSAPENAIAHFEKEAKAETEMMKMLGFEDTGPSTYSKYVEFAKGLKDNPSFTNKGLGNMYQVKINADPEHFLDWDRPLSEQSPHVQANLRDMAQDVGLPMRYWSPVNDKEAALGEEYYNALAEKLKNKKNPVWDTNEASSELKTWAIPGIKYLDQGSRDAKSGSHNYVVFDDKLIDILKKYGFVGLLGGGMAMNVSQQQSQPGL